MSTLKVPLRRRRLDLVLEPRGECSRVLLDGEQLPGIHKVVITAQAGHVTQITLEGHRLDEPYRYSFVVVEKVEDGTRDLSSPAGLREQANRPTTEVASGRHAEAQTSQEEVSV